MLGFSPNLTSYGPAPKYQKLLLPVPLRANQILPICQVPDHKLNTIKLHRVLYMYTHAQTHTHRQSQKEHIPDPSVTYFHLTRTEATLYEDFYRGAQHGQLRHISAQGTPCLPVGYSAYDCQYLKSTTYFLFC